MESVFSGIADRWYYSNRSLFSLSSITTTSSLLVLALTTSDGVLFFAICLEWFFYGKVSVPCALTCTLAKEVQLFLGLGLYSGIFVMYLHCSSSKSRTATILFYALCLLYVLSTAIVVSDLIDVIFQVSNNFICKNIIFYQLCSCISIHDRLNFKLTHCQFYFTFQLFKS